MIAPAAASKDRPGGSKQQRDTSAAGGGWAQNSPSVQCVVPGNARERENRQRAARCGGERVAMGQLDPCRASREQGQVA